MKSSALLLRLLLALAILSPAVVARAASPAAAARTVFQCPMHPWIKSDHAGKCTICGMDLVANSGGMAAADPDLISLSPGQVAATGVQVSAVKHGPLARSLRVNGVIDDDDTRHRILTARVPGRIEKLLVNFVGAEVREGEPLATIYSPEMLTAQRTYVERLRAGTTAFTVSERAAAREQLLDLGLTEEEIVILEHTLQPTAIVNLRSPMSGTVVSRNVYEGQLIARDESEQGTRLFEIGDFSRMWFVFDVYEPDLSWVRAGLPVEVSVPSVPGRVLTAPIDFINPNVDPMTRTAKARVVLQNPDRLLYHGQTAQALVRLQPPDVLLVPRSAVLQHSGHPIVFLDRGEGRYAAREIQLGRAGDSDAEVVSGLADGDRVVTQGALLLDGQAQLAHAALGGEHDHAPTPPTKVSAEEPGHDAAAYAALRDLAFATADGAAALAADDVAAYQKNLPAMRDGLKRYLASFPGAARGPLATSADALADPADLKAARRAFEPFSTAVVDLARGEHVHHREGLHIFQCPMTPVLGTGRWFSRADAVKNPFFGSAMLECGEALE